MILESEFNILDWKSYGSVGYVLRVAGKKGAAHRVENRSLEGEGGSIVLRVAGYGLRVTRCALGVTSWEMWAKRA